VAVAVAGSSSTEGGEGSGRDGERLSDRGHGG
jgi:hypothetical protein